MYVHYIHFGVKFRLNENSIKIVLRAFALALGLHNENNNVHADRHFLDHIFGVRGPQNRYSLHTLSMLSMYCIGEKTKQKCFLLLYR